MKVKAFKQHMENVYDLISNDPMGMGVCVAISDEFSNINAEEDWITYQTESSNRFDNTIPYDVSEIFQCEFWIDFDDDFWLKKFAHEIAQKVTPFWWTRNIEVDCECVRLLWAKSFELYMIENKLVKYIEKAVPVEEDYNCEEDSYGECIPF